LLERVARPAPIADDIGNPVQDFIGANSSAVWERWRYEFISEGWEGASVNLGRLRGGEYSGSSKRLSEAVPRLLEPASI
jgi:hypothetical protein